MTYIVPDSRVEFFTDIGLSDNYENTIYFASTSAKDNYFTGLNKIASATAMSYNRATRGSFRVELPMSTLYNASYCRFKNTGFENKWFYAFIKSVEYINNATTEVYFDLDVLMTWQGAYTLGTCFVERQHVTNDSIGANIADEGLTLGNYEIEAYYSPNIGTVMSIAVQEAVPEGHGGGINGGCYSGCLTHICSSETEANQTIQGIIDGENKVEGLVNVFMLPNDCVTDEENHPVVYQITVVKPYTTVNGYVPKNNKLFTYPYKYLEVDNLEGSHSEYMYEYFNSSPPSTSGGSCNFNMYSYVLTKPERLLAPTNYKGLSENLNECTRMVHFPSCPFSYDIFKAYLSQVKSNLPLEMLNGATSGAMSGGLSGAMIGLTGGVVGAVGGGLTGASLGAIGGAIKPVISALSMEVARPEQGTASKGAGDTDILSASGKKDFKFYGKCITHNYAKMIDDFFTAYGYAVREWRVPNNNARPYFTYIKTSGCNVHGDVPSDHASRIEKIFDNGIRFWTTATTIGNYNVDNSIV